MTSYSNIHQQTLLFLKKNGLKGFRQQHLPLVCEGVDLTVCSFANYLGLITREPTCKSWTIVLSNSKIIIIYKLASYSKQYGLRVDHKVTTK